MDRNASADRRSTRESGTYDYYFRTQADGRPAFVTRLLERKHRMMLDLAHRGRPISSMMELGPGEGFVARAASRRGIDYTAVEASSIGADVLRGQGIRVIEATVPPIPEGAGPVDLLYASHLIEHLDGPMEVLRLLADARDVLAPAGAFALVYPDYNWMKKDFWDCDYTHRWPSTPRRVTQVAHDAGYEVVAEHPTCLNLHGNPAMLLRMLAKLYPHRFLSWIDQRRADLWFRGSLLFAANHITVLSPR